MAKAKSVEGRTVKRETTNTSKVIDKYFIKEYIKNL